MFLAAEHLVIYAHPKTAGEETWLRDTAELELPIGQTVFFAVLSILDFKVKEFRNEILY